MGWDTLNVVRGSNIINEVFKIMVGFDGKWHICGGFARWCLSPHENPSEYDDIDIFLIDNSFESCRTFFNNKGIGSYNNYNKSFVVDVNDLKLNIISKDNVSKYSIDSELSILQTFDFYICKACVKDIHEGIVHSNFTDQESKKYLSLSNATKPISTLKRCFKYINKGYKLMDTDSTIYMLFEEWDVSNNNDKLKQFRSLVVGGHY